MADAIAQERELFYCTFNTTTFAQITDAIEDGLLPVCIYRDNFYVYTGLSNGYYCFSSIVTTTAHRLYVKQTWGHISFEIGTYIKPTDGIPSSDLSETVQEALEQAHTHTNKTVLDDISSEDVASWDAKMDAPQSAVAGDAMVFDGDNWTKQSGYGYEKTVSGAIVDDVTMDNWTNGYAFFYKDATSTPLLLNIVEGNTYVVDWNGDEYSCVAYSMSLGICIGNSSIISMGTDTGEPFLFMNVGSAEAISWYAQSGDSVNVTVTGEISTITPIDLKYISPDPTKAPIDSPNFTGMPTAPTLDLLMGGDDRIATTAYVQGEIELGAEALINQWDEQIEFGRYVIATGEKTIASDQLRTVNLIPVKPGKQYYFHIPSATGVILFYYANDRSFITSNALNSTFIFTVPNNAYFLGVSFGTTYGTTYNHNISINYPRIYTGYYPSALPKAKAEFANNEAMLMIDGYISPVINGIGNYRDGNIYHKRIGRVNLGELYWSKSSVFYTTDLSNVMKTKRNGFCNSFPVYYSGGQAPSAPEALQLRSDGYIYLSFTASSIYAGMSAGEIRSALQGIYLYYELVTEITRNIDGSEIGESISGLGNAIGMRGWNQLIKNGNFPNADGWVGGVTATVSAANGKLKITTGTAGTNPYAHTDINIPLGHKVLMHIGAIDWSGTSTHVTRVLSV